tara:strand:+ start:49 stop:504 length:456 start_codon:yes stop_codon:yes gene_type:complete
MSSIPELLRKGFENDDWSYVSEAHKILTGEYLLVDESLEPQEVEVENKSFSESVRGDDSSYISKVYDGDKPSFKTDGGGQAARKESIQMPKERVMVWKDDGTIAANEKVSENPSLGVSNPVERNRKAARGQSKQAGDVRLDRSEKLKDINE